MKLNTHRRRSKKRIKKRIRKRSRRRSRRRSSIFSVGTLEGGRSFHADDYQLFQHFADGSPLKKEAEQKRKKTNRSKCLKSEKMVPVESKTIQSI